MVVWGQGLGTWRGVLGSVLTAAQLPVNLLPFASSSQEGGGGQSAPAEPTQVAMDSQARKSSALGPKGRGTRPGMETGKGTAGSGSPGMRAGTQGETATPVKLSGAPSDHTRSIGAGATTPGMQPGSRGTQATTRLGTQPGAPDTQASTSGMQPGSPGTHTTTPGVQPASSRSQATIPGDAQEPAKPWGSTSTSSYESEMREVLSQVGQLGHLCTGLKEQVEQLKSTKAEHADLENLRRLFPKGGESTGGLAGVVWRGVTLGQGLVMLRDPLTDSTSPCTMSL